MSLFYETEADAADYHLMIHKQARPALPHFHAATELIVVKRGHMLAHIGGSTLSLAEGEGCFADAFCVHSYEIPEEAEIFVFVGNAALVAPVLSDLGGVPPVRFRFSHFDLLTHMLSLYDSAPPALRLSVFKGSIRLLITEIARENALCAPKGRGAARDITEVLRYIGEHFTEPITLGTLARTFGYSPPYLSRLFHKHVAMNVTEYIGIARVNYAIRLLDAGKSVTDAAFTAGFGSMPSFYRAYKKLTEAPPKG